MGGAEGCGLLSLPPPVIYPAVAGGGGQALVIQPPCWFSNAQCFLWSLPRGLCTSQFPLLQPLTHPLFIL